MSKKRIFLVSAGGGFRWETLSLLKSIHDKFEIILLATGRVTSEDSLGVQVLRVPAITTFSQNLPNRLISTMKAMRVFFGYYRQWQPVAVICLGSSLAVPFFLAARLLRIKTVFIESITRVEDLSRTAKVVSRLRLANRLYSQWPEAIKRDTDRVVYRGTIL